jgi:hypothetical protein
MTKHWKNTLLCSTLAVVLMALLIQGAVFATTGSGPTYARDKLKTKTIESPQRPSIAAAQNLTAQAYDKVIDAQKVGEWDQAGHAQKAKAALQQAKDELRLAAEATDAR